MKLPIQEILSNTDIMKQVINLQPTNQNFFSLFEDIRLIEEDEQLNPTGAKSEWINYQPIFTQIGGDLISHLTMYGQRQSLTTEPNQCLTLPVLVEYTYVSNETLCRQTYVGKLKNTIHIA